MGFKGYLAGARAYSAFRKQTRKLRGTLLALPEPLSFFNLPSSGEVLITGESGVGKTGLVFSLCEALSAEGYPIVYYDLDRSLLGAHLDVDQGLFKVMTDPDYVEFGKHLATTKSMGQMIIVLSAASNLFYETDKTYDKISGYLFDSRGGDTLIINVERKYTPGFDACFSLSNVKNYRRDGQVEYVLTDVRRADSEGVETKSFLTKPGGRLSVGGAFLAKIKQDRPDISMLSSFDLPSGKTVRGGMNLIRAIDEGKELTWKDIYSSRITP